MAFRELASPGFENDALDARKVALGRRLFFDPRLSQDGALSCASCHRPDEGWTIARPVATGHAGLRGRRNPLALHTVALRRHWGWDGRHASLARQSLAPLTQPEEMGNPDMAGVLSRLAADRDYPAAFATVYGDAPISETLLADALAAFQSTLDRPSRFDRFLAGDHTQLDDREIWGLHLFRTRAGCANCHFGPLLTDERFHNLKISSFGEKAEDLGRYRVTGRPEDTGAMRTPSLRHVGETAPYMHNGLFATLEGVVNLYDRGGGEVWARNAAEAAHPLYPRAVRISPHIRPLGLSEAEKAALVAFLKAL